MVKNLRHTYLLILLALLTACANDIDEPAQIVSSPYIAFGMGSQPQGLQWSSLVESRAAATLPCDMPETIGVWGYNDVYGMSYSGAGEVFKNVEMYYRLGRSLPDDLDLTPFGDNNWPYRQPMPWLPSSARKLNNYKFYGYAPHVPNYNTTATDPSVVSIGSAYLSFQGMVLHNIPIYSDVDYIAGESIVNYQSKMAGSEEANDVQTFNMRHLLARMRFCFTLGYDYSELREIRLRRLDVLNFGASTYSITVDFSRAQPFGEPVDDVISIDISDPLPLYYEKQQDDDPDRDYLELSKRYTGVYRPFTSAFVVPKSQISSIRIKVYYDVYDSKGHLLRENETAINEITLPFGATGNRTLQAGYYYDVNIAVVPTFLYVLSDNDPLYPVDVTDGYLEIPASN